MDVRTAVRRFGRGIVATLVVTALAPNVAAAAPDDPEPDYTVLGDLALCGEIHVGTLTIPSGSTLRVATVPDSTVRVPSREGDPPKQSCDAASVGALTVVADRIINNGTIDADGAQATGLQPEAGPGATYTGNPPTGNGGGGHLGPGGDGSTGTGGDAYGFADPAAPVTERGMPGSGTAPGSGGGAVMLRAREIVSTGLIRANGSSAADDETGTCGQLDLPQTDADEAVPLSGNHGPGGGGAGGGIVLAASRLQMSGPLQARGGDGGFGRRGGGGGGGGGEVKLVGPIQILVGGFSVDVSGGSPGGTCTSGNLPSPLPFPGAPGGSGQRVDVAIPEGTAHDPASFWNRGGVRVPIDAAGSYDTVVPSGFTVHICGLRSALSTQPLPANYMVPSSNSPSDPCGPGATSLASRPFSVFDVEATDADGFVDVALSGGANDGYWGVWAAVVRDDVVSSPPAQVQTVFGIDNTAPEVEITSPPAGFEVTDGNVVLAFTVTDPAASGVPSGIASIECRNELPEVTSFQPCISGQNFALSPGYGPKRIGVRATDVVGNQTSATVSGAVVNAAPQVAADHPSVTVPEGTTATMSGTFADSEPVTLAASVGSIVPTGPGTWAWSLPTTDGPAQSQTVIVTATDALGAESRTSFALVVDNVAPSVSIDVPANGSQHDVGETVAISAAFADAGAGDTHTATVDWGDGSTSNATVTESVGSGSAIASHPYATAGTYTVTVTVVDDDGGVGIATRSIVVSRVATKLVAEPAILRVGPGVVLHLFDLQARLTRADTGAPITGEKVVMTVPGIGGAPVVICTAVTGTDGRATCSGLSSALAILLNVGYTATFMGSPTYLPATTQGPLVVVRLRLALV